MPKSGKKGTKKIEDITSDVKLSDFANCSAIGAGRLRKSAANALNKQVKDICDSEKLWFERDDEEFEFFNENKLESDNEKSKRKSNLKAVSSNSPNSEGIRYPLDVWFHIGQYIKPEDVRTFASLCKDSYYVTRTHTFWLKMYKRHYRPGVNLPRRLQPDSIEGALCLKTCVIRALYYMYPRFTKQLSLRASSTDVHNLSNLCCTSMWRVQQNGKWEFYFKFQMPTVENQQSTYIVAIRRMWSHQDTENLKEMENYVIQNPDEGCKVLQVSCSNFVAVPPFVMGSRLSNANINLAHDMCHQKLQLIFCYSNYKLPHRLKHGNKQSGVYGDIVEFDSVENVAVLNWWDPQYPSGYKSA